MAFSLIFIDLLQNSNAKSSGFSSSWLSLSYDVLAWNKYFRDDDVFRQEQIASYFRWCRYDVIHYSTIQFLQKNFLIIRISALSKHWESLCKHARGDKEFKSKIYTIENNFSSEVNTLIDTIMRYSFNFSFIIMKNGKNDDFMFWFSKYRSVKLTLIKNTL